MRKTKVVVAVDGPAGSGKSTVCREAARRLGIKYIDSGAVYRAITWLLLDRCGKITREDELTHHLAGITITQTFNEDGVSRTFVNGDDVSERIRNEKIAENIGIISDDRGIRNHVNSLLRAWSMEESVIMDGRDIGSVVFPHAEVKIYLDASVEVRAQRRVHEYVQMGKTVDGNDIKKQIIRRDREDKSRSFGRLLKTPDSLYVDTSAMSREEVVNWLVATVSKAMKGKRPRE